MTGKTTLRVSDQNKERLEAVGERAMNDENATHNSIIGFLTNYYLNNE